MKKIRSIAAVLALAAATSHAGVFNDDETAGEKRRFVPMTVMVWTQVVDPATQAINEDVCANCKVEVRNWVRGENGRTDSYVFQTMTDEDGAAVAPRAMVGPGESGSVFVKAAKFGIEERDAIEYAQGRDDLRAGIVIRKQ